MAKRAMKTSRKRRSKTTSEHPVTDLPFVKDTAKKRLFWNVAPTGDYVIDCAIGQEYALAYLEYLAKSISGTLMPQILPHMPRTTTGIEVGFFTMVDHAAKHGRAAAFELAAYWSRRRAEEHQAPKAS